MNIKDEEKFLELFGFIVSPCPEGYMVLDENNNPIGRILEIDDEHYQVSVQTPLLTYDIVRRFGEKIVGYDFFIRYQEENLRASIALKDKRGIKIKSNSMGNFYLEIDANRLFLEFDEIGNEATITERVELMRKPCFGKKEEDYEKKYMHYVKIKKAGRIGSDAVETSFSRSYKEKEGTIKRKVVKYKSDHMATITTTVLKTDFESAISEHHLGIEAAGKFFFLLNNLIPLNPELITGITMDLENVWEDITFLLPDKTPQIVEDISLAVNK